MTILAFLVTNWLVILIGLIVLGFVGTSIYKFAKLPLEKKYKTIRAYLLYLVAIAEQNWGSGTGPIKLGEVYDAFTKKYPIIKLFISWETFKKIVDSALAEMRMLLEAKAKKEAEEAARLAESTPTTED